MNQGHGMLYSGDKIREWQKQLQCANALSQSRAFSKKKNRHFLSICIYISSFVLFSNINLCTCRFPCFHILSVSLFVSLNAIKML